jgi:hypothetical protein
MELFKKRFQYLFQSTKGLVLVAIAMISITAAVFGMLSGPMAEWGVSDFVADLLNMDLIPKEREGRIVMLYHSIAMAVVAIEVYLITGVVPMKKHQRTNINAIMTVGYLVTMIFGLGFAYWGHNFIFHGLFIFGNSLIFFAGVMLSVALWPWKKEYYVKDNQYAHTKKGVDLERVAFFVMAVATLGSSIFGAVAGANTGNGFTTFLAENTIRTPGKDPLMLAVIGHLHIMLTLIAVAIALLIGRWVDFKGGWHKVSMPLMIFGTIIITLGVWLVVPYQFIAHYIIYGGSTMILLAGLFLLIYNWGDIIKKRTAELGLENPSFGQKFKALFHDPLRFGVTWQMLIMNFTTSFIGIFFAVKLDEVIRKWPAREERIELAGHWHVLSAIVATIILFYFADMMGLKGKARKWFGWLILIFSNIAFFSTTVFYIKRMFISEGEQQGLVDTIDVLIESGLAVILVMLALFMGWRLIDLFKKKGLWAAELADAGLEEEDK